MPKRSRNRGRCYELEKPTTSITRDTSYKWTAVGFPQIRFSWAIEHFSSWIAKLCRRRVKVAYSPEFPNEPPGATVYTSTAVKWRLRFEINEEHVSLYLEPVRFSTEIEVNYYIEFYGNHQKIIAKGDRLKFVPNSDEQQGFEGLMELDLLVGHVRLRGDKLVISCEMGIVELEERSRKSNDYEIQLFHVANDKLNADMGKLLEMDQYGDVELVVGNRKFSAYKGILAARSSVFADMFNERSINRFEIANMEPDMFQELLRYIYTDQVSELATLKFKLYPIAERFNIESLMQLCQDAIMADISLETVSDVLKTGDTYELPLMKHHALTFIRDGPIGITRTRGWKELVRTHPHLADEALEVLAKKVAVANQRDPYSSCAVINLNVCD